MPSDQSTPQTILFADIADSTALYEKLGDAAARKTVADPMQIMIKVVRSKQGHVVKTMGDGVMGRFDSPDTAAETAVCIHESVASDPSLASRNIQLRIGFHHGPVIEADKDYYGDAVNVAARMAAQAKAGQTITSRQTLDLLCEQLRATSRMVDQARVKGKTETIEIFELAWGQPEELTMMGSLTGELVNRDMDKDGMLTLDMQDCHISIDLEHPVASLGRDQGNHMVINDPKVSRLHAKIEIRRGKFVLIDQSTNGTYLYPDGRDMLLLRRDEATLVGEGYFCLGQATSKESPQAIHYLCL